MRVRTLEVEGASLHVECRGAGGPLVLLIPGGPLDAGIYAGLAEALSDRFTAVAYDPRGNSRSIVEDATRPQDIALHADDAARLIESLGECPAFVFGSSAGGQIALALAARRPEIVRRFVAHEPPCIALLPDAEAVQAQSDRVMEIFRAEGVWAAARAFREMNNLTGPAPANPHDPALAERTAANMEYFFRTGYSAVPKFRPDVDSLRSHGGAMVGIGATSADILPARAARALAAALDVRPVTLPGGHAGYAEDPGGFASVLSRLFA